MWCWELEERVKKKIPPSDLVNMAEFALKITLNLTLKSRNRSPEQP